MEEEIGEKGNDFFKAADKLKNRSGNGFDIISGTSKSIVITEVKSFIPKGGVDKMANCLRGAGLNKHQEEGGGSFTKKVLGEMSHGVKGSGSYKLLHGNNEARKLINKINKARIVKKITYIRCCVELKNDGSTGNKNGCFEGPEGCEMIRKECVEWKKKNK